MAEPGGSAVFDGAIVSLRAMSFRSDLSVREIAAPTELAPFSFALAADVRPDAETGQSEYGTGRLVVLHDPAQPDSWGGAWRIVSFAQAPLEPEIGSDPLLADVAWSWLVDALRARRAEYHDAAGTATKTISRGFGTLAAEGDGSQIELRASWTPEGTLTAHVDAWAELVCMLAGLPPGSEGVEVISTRRMMRD